MVEQIFKAEIKRGRMLLKKKEAGELTAKGYGEVGRKYVELSPLEALHLVYSGKLDVVRRGKVLGFDFLMEIVASKERDLLPRFLIYRDLRSRGYVVKSGYGEKIDFLVYERGDYPVKPAKYRVVGVDEGHHISLQKLIDILTFSTLSKKELKLAVIERRGEIVYYTLKMFRGGGEAE